MGISRAAQARALGAWALRAWRQEAMTALVIDSREWWAITKAMYETWRRETDAGAGAVPWMGTSDYIRKQWLSIALEGLKTQHSCRETKDVEN